MLNREWPEYHYENRCRDCNLKDQLIDECGEYFGSILKILFSRAELDKRLLADYIDALAHRLSVDVPNGWIQIERTKPEIVTQEWLAVSERPWCKITK